MEQSPPSPPARQCHICLQVKKRTGTCSGYYMPSSTYSELRALAVREPALSTLGWPIPAAWPCPGRLARPCVPRWPCLGLCKRSGSVVSCHPAALTFPCCWSACPSRCVAGWRAAGSLVDQTRLGLLRCYQHWFHMYVHTRSQNPFCFLSLACETCPLEMTCSLVRRAPRLHSRSHASCLVAAPTYDTVVARRPFFI